MSNDRLRLVLRLNALSSLATGVLLALAASPLSGPMGAAPGFLRIAGLGLVPFALFVGWLAERDEPSTNLVSLVSACDFSWVAASLYVVFAMPITGLGKAGVLAVALVVEIFGSLQLLYASRRGRSRIAA